MGAAYSQDLRDRVIAARQRGLKTRQVARLLQVSDAWVRRVMQRFREYGETQPRPRGGVTVVKIDMDRLRELVEHQPDATIPELHERLGVACSESAVGMALKRLGFTFKKRRSMPANSSGLTLRKNACDGKANSRCMTRAD